VGWLPRCEQNGNTEKVKGSHLDASFLHRGGDHGLAIANACRWQCSGMHSRDTLAVPRHNSNRLMLPALLQNQRRAAQMRGSTPLR
jgi:hypothetical protein